MVPQVKVQWSGMDESLSTSEDAESLRLRFPAAPAWGQAGFDGKGNVSTKEEEEAQPPTTSDHVPEELDGVARRGHGKRNRRAKVRVFGPD